MSIEAMKLALEHIEGNYTVSDEEAITALRQAIEQAQKQERTGSCPLEDCDGGPETHGCWAHNCEWKAQKQEPVAWLSKGGKGIWFHKPDTSLDATPLYTAPPLRQPLTDEECDAIYNALDEWAHDVDEYELGLPRIVGEGFVTGRKVIRQAIKAANGIKENT